MTTKIIVFVVLGVVFPLAKDKVNEFVGTYFPKDGWRYYIYDLPAFVVGLIFGVYVLR